MRRRFAIVLASFAVLGCASAPRPAPALLPRSGALPALPASRVALVEQRAPELAELFARVHELAEMYARRGELHLARELAHLAQLGLLSAAELAHRLDASEVRVSAREELDAVEAAARDREAALEEARRLAEAAEAQRPRRRSRPAAAEDEAAGAGAEEASDEPPAEPGEGEAVRVQLARLAQRLSALSPSDDRQVVVAAIQNALIAADRALAEDLVARAQEHAAEAARLLANLTGEPAPAAPAGAAPSAEAFVRDARARLGARATVHAGAVALRLDGLVRYRDGRWSAGAAEPLDELGALVRAYRSSALRLVTVEPASGSPFVAQQDTLRAFLAGHLRVPSSRLAVVERVSFALPPGAYLVASAGADR
ncbi:MAG: hypothetical protein KF729_14040 [Sandaracinaceae bacterium]|nr:hypothetical protein [Sandaracinaceae bacterium]